MHGPARMDPHQLTSAPRWGASEAAFPSMQTVCSSCGYARSSKLYPQPRRMESLSLPLVPYKPESQGANLAINLRTLSAFVGSMIATGRDK